MAKYVYIVPRIPKQAYKLSSYAKSVSSSIFGNKFYPNAGSLLAILDTHTAELDKADAAAANGDPGAAAARLAARGLVKQDVRHLVNHVQGVLEGTVGTADLQTIQAMAESAAMDLRKVGARPKAVFGAKYGPVPGSVDLTAPASRKREPHEWQYSTDQQTWTSLPGTLRASTTVMDLTVGVPHYFRHRLLTKDGYTEWSDPTVMIVVK